MSMKQSDAGAAAEAVRSERDKLPAMSMKQSDAGAAAGAVRSERERVTFVKNERKTPVRSDWERGTPLTESSKNRESSKKCFENT